ncbi:MAG: thiamine phosphate synthase [Acidobacteriota bacterium]|jgi:thiamine-phosphate pyrophosphorylase
MAITDRRSLAPRPFDGWLRELAAAGVDAVQIREKDLDDLAVYRLARHARATLPRRVAVLVNGRLDVALAAGADGVHLPAAGLPAEPLRRWASAVAPGRRIAIGRSTHTPQEVARAREERVDYVTFGPLFPTPSKAAHGPPPGPEGLRRAAAEGVPVVALGGVDAEGVAAAVAAGAAGVAGIRVFQDPDALRKLTAALARESRRHRG